MSIVLATTLITIMGHRPQLDIDIDARGYDGAVIPDEVLLAQNVRACISQPVGSRQIDGTDEIEFYTVSCDVSDINRYDTIIDETNLKQYRVHEVQESTTQLFGLEHTKARVKLLKGLASLGNIDASGD